MRMFKFNIRDCPEDATDFYYTVLNASVVAGFPVPERMLARKTGKKKVKRYDILEALGRTWGRAAEIDGHEWALQLGETQDHDMVMYVVPDICPDCGGRVDHEH